MALLLICCTRALAQTPIRIGGVDGNVAAMARSGNTLYVGGFFINAGPVSGSCVSADPVTGTLDAEMPEFDGEVRSIIADGVGGWFVGGAFRAVSGWPHGGLAHLDSRLRLTAWDPTPDGIVHALALSGDTLVVGGSFLRIAGEARNRIAAFRLRDGALLPSWPEPNGIVRALLVHGDRLVIGGEFDSVATNPRRGLAEINLRTGALAEWRVELGIPGGLTSVRCLASRGDTLLAGGVWVQPGFSRQCLLAADLASGALVPWAPLVTGPGDDYFSEPHVDAIVVEADWIYLGGHFTQVNAEPRSGLAKVSLTSGGLDAWAPSLEPQFLDLGPEVFGLARRGDAIYVVGWFIRAAGESRICMAAVDKSSGTLLPWNIGADERARVVTFAGERVLIGGAFRGAGADWNVLRTGLVAFDLQTGKVKDWNPQLSGLGVNTITLNRGALYVGGYFDAIGGAARYCLGAVDTLTGQATAFDPAVNGPVFALRVIGDTLYVGGAFGVARGTVRRAAAAFDLGQDALLPWAPDANDAVRTIEAAGETVLIGGDFWRVGGVLRSGLASVDRLTGALGSLDCGPGFPAVYAVAAVRDTLFVGGSFQQIGGQPRVCLAALDPSTGLALDWRADSDGYVTSLALVDTVLYAGGIFGRVAGQPRAGLAALSRGTGALLADPGTNSTVWSLLADGNDVFVGGGFARAFGHVCAGLAGLSTRSAPPVPEPLPHELRLSSAWPNPCSRSTTLEFALPVAGEVSVQLYDPQGRRMLPLVARQPKPAGRNQLHLELPPLASGVYFLRLSAGNSTASERLLVLR